MMINTHSNDMRDKDIEKLNQDSGLDEDRLIFQTDAQREKYQRMLADKKQHELIDDEDEITTVINKIWHRMVD
ncbi:MAG: hypothetical protein QNJ69_02960 [Gammaproteobacteria bacterium]|nr:hypothetical protein [Gammaproteobacteria bacterium]